MTVNKPLILTTYQQDLIDAGILSDPKEAAIRYGADPELVAQATTLGELAHACALVSSRSPSADA